MNKNERPIEHLLYPRHFETHTNLNLSPDWLELNLKFIALFYRGIVIADSDLNNNSNLQNLFLNKEELFAGGIKSGFISRVARFKEETKAPISQVELYEEFVRRNSSRGSLIPVNYPANLDKLFSISEKTNPAHVWKFKQLSTAFANRILLEFLRFKQNPGEKKLTAKILDYVESFKDTEYLGLFGSEIEKKYLPEHDSNKEQQEIWKRVLTAYGGNILSVFDGKIIVGEFRGIPSIRIPSGPESDINDIETAALFYNAQKNSLVEKMFEIGVNQISSNKRQNARYYLDKNKLLALSLNKIEELRESCNPQDYFQLRSSLMASEDNSESQSIQLQEAANSYWEKLCSQGIALTKKSNLDSIEQVTIRITKNDIKKAEEAISEDTKKLLFDSSKTVFSLIPGAGIYTTLVDIIDYAKRGGEIPIRKEALALDIQRHGEIYSRNRLLVKNMERFMQKRLDFRVVNRVNEVLLRIQGQND